MPLQAGKPPEPRPSHRAGNIVATAANPEFGRELTLPVRRARP